MACEVHNKKHEKKSLSQNDKHQTGKSGEQVTSLQTVNSEHLDKFTRDNLQFKLGKFHTIAKNKLICKMSVDTITLDTFQTIFLVYS